MILHSLSHSRIYGKNYIPYYRYISSRALLRFETIINHSRQYGLKLFRASCGGGTVIGSPLRLLRCKAPPSPAFFNS